MPTNYETGHAKNVANFEPLISFISGYGPTYNPSRVSIQLAAMQTQAANAKSVINYVKLSLPDYSNAVAIRDVGFKPLKKLCTRMINALKATDAPQQVIDNAMTINRKIQGTRASAKLGAAEKEALLVAGKEVNQISASQQSFDSILDSFDKQIKLLASIPQYTPNESDLQVATLQNLYNDLMAKNTEVIAKATPLSNARLTRNEMMYKEDAGLVDTALNSKTYIKSLYGASSPQYKQVSKLAFSKI